MNATRTAVRDSAFVTVVGTATGDATIADTKAGKPYARFSIKVETKNETLWISAICFDAGVVDSARAVRKDCRVDVGGRLQLRTWTGNDGQMRAGVGMVAETVTILEQPARSDAAMFDDDYFSR
jgi:single-stranded DNA-binding protein